MTITETPIRVTCQWRDRAEAAVSTDGQWAYALTPNGRRWAVTHTATGRRYWTSDLDRARRETADGTAAALLAVGMPLPGGKPLAKGEYRAVCDELSLLDLTAMLEHARAVVPELVAEAVQRVWPLPDPPHRGLGLRRTGMALGTVYGRAADVWLDALRAIRPDLVPPHLGRQSA